VIRDAPSRGRGWSKGTQAAGSSRATWMIGMKKLSLAGLAVSALWGGSAQAADLARPVPVYRPPPVVAYSTWTGCYVGGNVGGLWATKEWFDDVPGFAGTSMGTQAANGWLAGAQGGCNYQVGNWVFGIQGDYDWVMATGNNFNGLFPLLTDRANIRSLTSVTGRVGYAWDRFMLYVKGGGAWENDDYSILVNGFTLATASETRGGWTVGIGGEYAFLDWLTGFAEYDFYGFGTRTNTFAACTVAVCGSVASFPVDIKENKNVFKVGLNFKFGPTVPLVGKY
jgi:outer membrane immunogenic protein